MNSEYRRIFLMRFLPLIFRVHVPPPLPRLKEPFPWGRALRLIYAIAPASARIKSRNCRRTVPRSSVRMHSLCACFLIRCGLPLHVHAFLLTAMPFLRACPQEEIEHDICFAVSGRADKVRNESRGWKERKRKARGV